MREKNAKYANKSCNGSATCFQTVKTITRNSSEIFAINRCSIDTCI